MTNLENGWSQSRLEKLTSLIKDGSHGTHGDVPDGVPLLSAKDVRDGSLEIPDDCRRISETDYASIHRNYKIGRNDILLTIVGSIGRCCLMMGIESRFSIQRSVAVIRPDTVVPGYLYHFFRSEAFQKELRDLTNASAQGGVYLASLAKCLVRFPSSELEQATIAEILSTVDRAIKQTEALIAKQQRIKTGLMKDFFTRGIDEQGNLRSEQTHQFKDSPLGKIPVEWQVKELKEICDVTSSKRIFFSDYKTEGVPFYRSKEIIELVRSGFTAGELYIEETKFNEIEKIFGAPAGGDILISSVGTLGVCYLVKDSDRFYFKDGNLIWLRSFKDPINRGFLVAVLPKMIGLQFDSLVIGTSQKAFTIEKLNLMKIPQPSPNEQSRLASALDELESYTTCQHESLAKLHSLKAALMQDLLTGKKRVATLLKDTEAAT